MPSVRDYLRRIFADTPTPDARIVDLTRRVADAFQVPPSMIGTGTGGSVGYITTATNSTNIRMTGAGTASRPYITYADTRRARH